MATVMIAVGKGVYSLDRYVEVLMNFLCEVRERGLEEQLKKAVENGNAYIGSQMIYVDEEVKEVCDVLLDVTKEMRLVPAIV